MRTLEAIIKAVEDGETPDQDELRYAVLVLNYLAGFDRDSHVTLAEHAARRSIPVPGDVTLEHSAQCIARHVSARSVDPKEWVGWANDPDNEEFQRRRRAAKPTIH